ncbi:MAG: hypothetical protein WKF96_10765 [Solirubrobacteraceae bacterium]
MSNVDARLFAAALRAALLERPRLDWQSATCTKWDHEWTAWTGPPTVPFDPTTGMTDWSGNYEPEQRKDLIAFIAFLEGGSFSIY